MHIFIKSKHELAIISTMYFLIYKIFLSLAHNMCNIYNKHYKCTYILILIWFKVIYQHLSF